MNIYELFGLVLVIAMVAAFLVAAHALGEGDRALRRAEEAAEKAEKPEKRSGRKSPGNTGDRENSKV